MQLAKRCMQSANAQTGIVVRIIITDGGDSTCFEWQHGRGIVFPKFLSTQGDENAGGEN